MLQYKSDYVNPNYCKPTCRRCYIRIFDDSGFCFDCEKREEERKMKVELLHDSREVFIRGCLDIEYIDLVNFLKKECQERNIPNAKVIDFRRISNGNILIVDEETKRDLFGYKMPRREAYLINLEVVNNEVLHVVDDEEYYQLGVIENGKYRDEQVHPQDKDVEPYIDVEVIEYLLKGQGAIE